MRNLMIILAAAGFLGACAQKSAYETAVEGYEPTYCYKSLAGVSCYKKPYFRDERRLVNYFGPAPERYERPASPPAQKLFAPKTSNYWVKDPEPAPHAAPQGDLADRPWLTAPRADLAVASAPLPGPAPVKEPVDVMVKVPVVPAETLATPTVPTAQASVNLPAQTAAQDSRGLAAFLKRITEKPAARAAAN